MGEEMVNLPLKQTSAETTVEIKNKHSVASHATNQVVIRCQYTVEL